MFKKMIGYVKDKKFLGELVQFDLINGTIILMSDEETLTVKLEEAEILQEAFEIHGTIIYDKDILGTIDGKMYLVELHDNGDVTLHRVNDKYEVTRTEGTRFSLTENILEDFEDTFNLVGNVHYLKNNLPEEPEFVVQVVKDFNGKHFTYFYACNNKKDKEIDLIKVLFLGSTLIEEEHERRTLDYDTYMEAVKSGIYKEVSLQELQNYVTGMLYGKTDSFVDAEEEIEEEEEVVCGENCGCVNECEEDGGQIFHFDFSKVFAETEEDKSEPDTDAPRPDTDAPRAPVKCDKCGQYESDCYCDLWD